MAMTEIKDLGRWFEQESRALVLYARQWLDPVAAEDAVQDVFIRLIQEDRPPTHMKAWLYQAVRNRALNGLRSWRRRSRREEQAATETADCFESHPGQRIDAHLAENALHRLPPEEREVVTLRIWGGLTLEETAEVLGSSVPTVFRRYRASLAHIRKLMEETCPTKPQLV
jgi:RNA polymerase sigma-70 factor (ECF subfamily)